MDAKHIALQEDICNFLVKSKKFSSILRKHLEDNCSKRKSNDQQEDEDEPTCSKVTKCQTINVCDLDD